MHNEYSVHCLAYKVYDICSFFYYYFLGFLGLSLKAWHLSELHPSSGFETWRCPFTKSACSCLTFVCGGVWEAKEERGREALGWWDAIWREAGLLPPMGDFSPGLNSWHLHSDSEWEPHGTSRPCARSFSVLGGPGSHSSSHVCVFSFSLRSNVIQ